MNAPLQRGGRSAIRSDLCDYLPDTQMRQLFDEISPRARGGELPWRPTEDEALLRVFEGVIADYRGELAVSRPAPRLIRSEKRCSRCGCVKQIDEFGHASAQADGRAGWCRACNRAAQAARRQSQKHIKKASG